MSRYIRLFLFLFLFPITQQPMYSAAPDNDAVKQQVLSGIDAMYSMHFDEAQGIFNDLITRNPDDPTAYFLRSSIHLWKYLFDNSEADLKDFLIESDRTIDIAEKAIDKHPDDTYARTYIGALYGFRTLANVRAENYLKASWDARSCYNTLSEVLKKDPHQYEAYLGMGIFHFLVGVLPSTSRFMMNLVGLSGNKEQGIREIEIAAEKASYVKNDAMLALGLLYVYYKGDYDKGIGYLKKLLEKYPNNIPVLYAMGNIEAQLKKMDNAIVYYQKVIELSSVNFRTFTNYSNFRMGEAYFRLNEFEKSKQAMQKYAKTAKEPSYKATGLFRLGECYELAGNREYAKKVYERVLTCLPVMTEDRYAIRKAKAYLAAPISELEIQLIKGENNVESLQFDKGETLLRGLLNSGTVPREIQAEAWYYLAETYRHRQRYEEAVNYYQKVVQTDPQQERWLMPWSYFRMSQIFYTQKKMEQSRTYLDKAKVFSDYDFEDWLTFLLQRDVTTLR